MPLGVYKRTRWHRERLSEGKLRPLRCVEDGKVYRGMKAAAEAYGLKVAAVAATVRSARAGFHVHRSGGSNRWGTFHCDETGKDYGCRADVARDLGVSLEIVAAMTFSSRARYHFVDIVEDQPTQQESKENAK